MGKTKITYPYGEKFGDLTVICESLTSLNGMATCWWCKCTCGKELIVVGTRLRSGNAKSCGCTRFKRLYKHHMTGRTEHNIWRTMLARCSNPNFKNYKYWGGKGIRVCERWKEFSNFYSDMGDRPSKDYSIDRIDGSKDYSPDNCKWSTRIEQNNNRSNVKVRGC